jgi:hypothetical protein
MCMPEAALEGRHLVVALEQGIRQRLVGGQHLRPGPRSRGEKFVVTTTMRSWRRHATIVFMATAAPSLSVFLVLDVDGEPIAGRLHGLQGEELAFRGWLDLASALQRLLEQARTAAPEVSAAPREDAA